MQTTLTNDVTSTAWKSTAVPLLRPAAATAAACVAAAALAAAVVAFDVPLVLGALLALAAGTTMLIRPDLATISVVLLLYLNVPSILVKQHGVPDFIAGAFILLLAVPLLHRLIVRREPLRADPVFRLMLALLAAFAISSMVAEDKEVAAELLLRLVIEGVLLYWLILNVIADRSTLRRTMWTVLASAALLSALSLYQDTTGDYANGFGGLAYRNDGSDRPVENGGGPHSAKRWDRAQGPVNEPNRFAQILIVLLPLGCFLFRTERSRVRRMCAAALTSLTLVGVVITFSRGAFLALVLMVLAMLWLRWLRFSHVAACAVCFVVAIPLVTPSYWTRVQTITTAASLVGGGGEDADGAIRGRITEMLAALHVFLDHPLIGVGPGQFSRFYVASTAVARRSSSAMSAKVAARTACTWKSRRNRACSASQCS